MKYKLIILIIPVFCYITGCSKWNTPQEKPEGPDWPMENKNLGRTASYGKPAVPPLTLKWKYQTQGEIIGNAAVVDGIVFFVSNDRNCYAVNANTGKLIWQQQINIGYIGYSQAAIVDHGTLYVGNGYALKETNGEVIWRSRGYSFNPAFVKDSVVIYAEPGNYWEGIDTNTGQLSLFKVWCCPRIGVTAVSDYLITCGWYVNEFDIWNINLQQNKQPKIKYHIVASEPPIWNSTFAVSQNRFVYIPTINEKSKAYGIMAIDIKNPKDSARGYGLYPIWQTTVKYATDPSYSKGVVYTGNGPVTALDAQNGNVLWSTELPNIHQGLRSTPAISDQWVYISNVGNEYIQYLYVLDTKTGKIIQQYDLSKASDEDYHNNAFCSTPAVVDGWVYVGSMDSCMYAFQGQEQTGN